MAGLIGDGELVNELRPTGIVPLGDTAAYVEFSETLDLALNAELQQLAVALRALQLPWISDVVSALGGIALHFNPDHPEMPATPLLAVAELVDRCLDSETAVSGRGHLVEIPVCYDPELALDLPEVAERLGLTSDEVARRHAAGDYAVLMIGFAPGHPYLGGLDPTLSVPRRSNPRAAVPAGSIAIANAQCVIYPYAIPGGWNLIGRTPLVVFDAYRDPPSLLDSRDRVRFVSISRADFDRMAPAGDSSGAKGARKKRSPP